MERKRQREIALAVVAALLIAAVAYRISTAGGSDATTATTGTGAPVAGSKPGVSQKGGVTGVNLEALQRGRPEPADSERNPFRFKPKPPPPPPPAPPRPVETGTPIPTGPIEPPPPPRITLKFIGVLENPPGSAKVAVFSDGRSAPISGREGEVIEGQYRIRRIGVESVELEYLDGRGRQTIRQTGQ